MLDSDPAVNLIYKGKYNTLILCYVVCYRLTDLFDRFIKNNQLKSTICLQIKSNFMVIVACNG